MPGLEQDDLKASLRQGGVEPLRQGPGLQPDAHDLDLQGGEVAHQSLRLRGHLRLADDLACPIHDANRRLVQGHVQTGIVLHGRPPSSDAWGWCPVPPSDRGTTTGQRSSSAPGPLPHLYVTAFVQPSSGETFWSVSNAVSKPFSKPFFA